jgi:hypothetical protein
MLRSSFVPPLQQRCGEYFRHHLSGVAIPFAMRKLQRFVWGTVSPDIDPQQRPERCWMLSRTNPAPNAAANQTQATPSPVPQGDPRYYPSRTPCLLERTAASS